MRLSKSFVIPLAAIVLSTVALASGARAQDGARPDPGAPLAGSLDPMAVDAIAAPEGDAGARASAARSGEHLLRIDSAREALISGNSLTAARELRQASSLLRLEAGRLDERARVGLLDVAARLTSVANDVELDYVDEDAFDRAVSSALRSLAGHHLALAQDNVARGDRAAADETARQLRLATEALERAVSWRGDVAEKQQRDVDDALDRARSLAEQIASGKASAAAIERGLARFGKALDDEIGRAGQGEPASAG